MTNFEKIKQMSVDELAEWMFFIKNRSCRLDKFCALCEECLCYEEDEICFSGLKQWLESEAENE